MIEMEIQTQNSKHKKQIIRQPPSIPFIWEEEPGFPKKNWKPIPTPNYSSSSSSSSSSVLPTKLVASIPFLWEEKPGIPLPIFSNLDNDFESEAGLSQVKSSVFEFECLFPPNAGFCKEADAVRKTTTTLGDLMRMSRMMSCRRKLIQMRKTDHSAGPELLKKGAFGCFDFGTISSRNMIRGISYSGRY